MAFDLAQLRRPSDLLVALLDVNARIGDVASPAVGGIAPEAEGHAGSCFHKWLLSLGLGLSTTFSAWHQEGPQWTWQSLKGSHHRLDFVGVPALDDVVAAAPARDFPFAIVERVDHVLVVVELVLSGACPSCL